MGIRLDESYRAQEEGMWVQHYDSPDSRFSRNLRQGAPKDFAAFIEFDK